MLTRIIGHKELWDIAKDANNGDVQDEDAQDRGDDEDQDDSEDEDEDDDEAEENTAEPAAADTPAPARSYKVFDDLLQFIWTTCAAVPHKTYPLLVVIISTLPQSLLPLADGPSPQLQTLFSHLWSPVDARLLSTHALPGQPSAFQALLRDSVDCTSYLIGKCSKIEGGEATAKWLVEEQLGDRVWKQGVLEFGGRSAGRRTVQARPETEASTFGQLLAKLGKTSIELQSDLLDSVKTTTLAQTDPADEKTALALLPRILPVLQAVEDVNEQEEVKTAIDQIRAEVAGQCAAALEAESLGPITTAYLEVLVSTIKDHPEVITSETQSVSPRIDELRDVLILTLHCSVLCLLSRTHRGSYNPFRQIYTSRWSILWGRHTRPTKPLCQVRPRRSSLRRRNRRPDWLLRKAYWNPNQLY